MQDDPQTRTTPQVPGDRAKTLRWTGMMAGLGCVLFVGCISLVRLFGPPAVTMRESFVAAPGQESFDHSVFDQLLGRHVDGDGLVDYQGLGADVADLDHYIEALGDARFDALTRDEKLALLINAYNAFTLRLMLEYPDVDSIRSIPSSKRWDAKRWVVGGQTFSLTQIENERIRPNFIEARVHWALVCAAIGCPPLRAEAYTGDRLEEQLAAQTARVFTRGTRWYQVSADLRKVRVSAIMNWYRGDFEQVSGSLADFVGAHDGAVREAIASGRTPSVSFLDYDWSLNRQANRQK